MATFFFDPSTAPDLNSVNEGPNQAVIGKAIMCNSQSGGKYLELEVYVDGMTIKDRFNTENSNATAVKMGLGKLKQLYAAVGSGPCDIEKLQGRRVTVILERKTNESTGKKYFEIVSYEAAQGTRPQQPPQNYQQPVPNASHPYAPGSDVPF